MIENEDYIEYKKHKNKHRFVPQVRINDKSFSQKDLSDSDYISPEFLENHKEKMSPSHKLKQSQRKKIPQSKPQTHQYGLNYQQFQFKKMLLSQNYVKKVVQKFISISQILKNKFKNNDLLVERYIGDQYEILDQNVLQEKRVIPVIQMNHLILKIWQIIKLLIYIFFMWWMPFKEAFIINKNVDFQDYIFLLIILLDIFIQINKEIIVQGQLIKDRRTILQFYFKNQIVFDVFYLLIYCLIIFQLVSQSASQILEVIFFFLNLKNFQNVIQNYQESTVSTNEKINLFELILTVYILTHFMACIWFSVGINSLNYYNESWIIKFNLLDQQLFEQYCYSLYWAATTMVTVGYGDITAQNLHEVICSFILIFFSSGIFAFSINSIGVILNNINQSQSNYKRSLLLINQHMDNNEVSANLQNKIRNYLKFYYNSSHSALEKDVDIVVEQLSQNLREELINDIRSKAVINNTFLQKYFSKQTQQILIQNLLQINCTPKEQIYDQMANDDHSLYIIQKGHVNIVDKTSKRIIYKLKQGDQFGEIELLTENPRYSSAYSVGFTKLLKISRSNFISIIKQDQQDFEQFHMLKDQIIFNHKAPAQCKVCFESHLIYNCHKLFYKPNLERIIKKELFHSNQERMKFKRNIINKQLSPLSNIEYIQSRCEHFRLDNNMEAEFNEENISKTSFHNSNNQPNKDISSLSHLKIVQDKHSDQSLRLTINHDQQFPKVNENKRQNYMNNIAEKINQTIRLPTKQESRQSTNNQLQNENQKYTYNQLPRQMSKIQSFSQLKLEDRFLQIEIDKPKVYKTYFILNNIARVILQYEKYQKNTQKEKQNIIPSNYRFFQLQKQKFFTSRQRIN